MKKHRNSQKRIKFQDACYFVTSKTFNNFPYFRERIFCDLFVENLILCKRLKGFRLYGWVLIYDHFHFMVQPNDEFDISDVMFSIKKHFSHDINRVMGFNKPYPPPKAAKRLAAFGRDDGCLPDNIEQTVIKHQNFVNQLCQMFIQKCNNKNLYPKSKWQAKFHDHYIRNDQDFNGKMKYIAWNPDKHNLPPDWPYVYSNPKYANLCDKF